METKITPLDVQCPTCKSRGWCVKVHRVDGMPVRLGHTHKSRIKLARVSEILTFHRVASDANGNPRYVVDWSNLMTNSELESPRPYDSRDALFEAARKRANSIGGAVYRGRDYRGGFVFQSYSVDETASAVSRVTGRHFVAQKG